MADMRELALRQLDAVIQDYEDMLNRYEAFSRVPFSRIAQFTTLARAAIDRIAGPDSVYARQLRA